MCAGRKKDGSPCKAAPPVGEDFCARHRPTLARVEPRKVFPRVRPEMVLTYEEFLAAPAPSDVKAELALLRTAQAEMVEIIENRREGTLQKVAEIVVTKAQYEIERQAEEEERVFNLDEIMLVVRDLLLQSLLQSFKFTYRSVQDVKEVGDILMKIVKAAEAYKKILEGHKVVVDINTDMVSNILKKAIFPVITSTTQRTLIIQNLQLIGLRDMGMPEGLEVLNGPGVVEDLQAAHSQSEVVGGDLARLLSLATVHSSVEGELVPAYVPSWGRDD